MKKIYKLTIALSLFVGLFSCSEDYLNGELTSLATGSDVAKSPLAVEALLNGIYNFMVEYQGSHDVFSYMSVQLAGDMMTEDVTMAMSHWFNYDNQIDNNGATYRRVVYAWRTAYTIISSANQVIAQIDPNTTDPEIAQMLGQALTLRALGHHIAIQRFQQTYKGHENAPGVPILLTGRDDDETNMGRGTVQQVYDRIFKDYLSAIALLEGHKRKAKFMVDQNVAAGLLARAYMCVEDWNNAIKYAQMAYAGYSLMTAAEAGTDGYNNISNKEWIWGADITGSNTSMFASYFSHFCSYDEGYGGAVGVFKVIDAKLFDQISATDSRRNLFKNETNAASLTGYPSGSNAPKGTNVKFKKVEGWLADYVFMRASEMYLIEAEALAHLGQGGPAADVLKKLMQNRDPAWNRATVSVEDVFLQKRIELWGEGVIFYDYLRLKKGVDRTYQGSNHLYKVTRPAGDWLYIYQIPQAEIDNNEEISGDDQNPVTGIG